MDTETLHQTSKTGIGSHGERETVNKAPGFSSMACTGGIFLKTSQQMYCILPQGYGGQVLGQEKNPMLLFGEQWRQKAEAAYSGCQ